MYAIYRELHPPTGVEHCLECNFFGPKRKSLAVAAASVLKVYDLCPVSAEHVRTHLLNWHMSLSLSQFR
jgi:hypothetical protein